MTHDKMVRNTWTCDRCGVNLDMGPQEERPPGWNSFQLYLYPTHSRREKFMGERDICSACTKQLIVFWDAKKREAEPEIEVEMET